MSNILRLTTIAALLAGASMAQAASLTSAGYTQNFDSLDTSGTTLPGGWAVYSIAGAHSD